MPPSSFESWTLDALVAGCREEAHLPRDGERGICVELVDRALADDGEAAWTAVQQQYYRLVRGWLRRAAVEPLLPGEMDDLLQETWLRFWNSLRSRGRPIGRSFPHIGSLLRYLNQVALTVVLDARRSARREARLEERLLAEPDEFVAERPRAVVDQVADHLQKAERLARIELWIANRVTDPLERLVLEESFTTGLDPIEIAAKHPRQFTDVQEVRKIKERLVKRARRALHDDSTKR